MLAEEEAEDLFFGAELPWAWKLGGGPRKTPRRFDRPEGGREPA